MIDTLKRIEKRLNDCKLPWETPTEAALYYDFLDHAKHDIKYLLTLCRKYKEGIEKIYHNSGEPLAVRACRKLLEEEE